MEQIHPVIGMESPLHYRCKVHAVFSHDRKGNPVSGIYEKDSHRVVPVDSCMIEDSRSDEIIVSIRDMLRSFRIRTYDEDTGFGLLRHVLVRKGLATNQYMVVLVTVDPVFPSKNNFVKALRQKYPEISTVVLNINSQNTSMVLGERNIVLYGPGYIEDELCGCRFRISPNSFYQVNPVQTEILYRKAIEYAHLTGKEEVLDAYCGTGTIGIIASSGARKVTGVELNPDAIRDAVVNAKRNQRSNIRFIRADATEYMENAEEIRPDIVIMDPPRSGSTERFIRAVGNLRPERVVYVSCDPQTLARDLRYFRKVHYRAVEAQPVDLFPFTGHVETCCLLVAENGQKALRVPYEVPAGLPSGTTVEPRADSDTSYRRIKEIVKQNTGLSVSSLYIAQVKEAYGIKERDCYNRGNGSGRVPQCPEAKRAAIEDALREVGLLPVENEN